MNPTLGALTEYDQNAPTPEETDTATFALGCFWGPDGQFGALDGVVRTRVGYAGGTKSKPTYHDLGDHTEVFQVDYLPEKQSFRDLLGLVFRSHTPSRQTPTVQYQNIVFVSTAAQREALSSYCAANDIQIDKIETRVEPLSRFHPAEAYHQKHSLRAQQSLLDAFETAGYEDRALRESPAAAKLNGFAAGRELPESHELGTSTNQSVHRS